MEVTQEVVNGVNELVNVCYTNSKEAGWHDNPRAIGTMLMLIVSELAEAMEGDRKGLMDDHLPHRTMISAELADAVIRIADLAGSLNIPLGDIIEEKVSYNLGRADHKRENRAKAGGKKY